MVQVSFWEEDSSVPLISFPLMLFISMVEIDPPAPFFNVSAHGKGKKRRAGWQFSPEVKTQKLLTLFLFTRIGSE